MEFWGIEVKPGETALCEPGVNTYLHLSQVTLGETKKPSEHVLVYLTVEGQEFVLGTLSGEKFPQASYDVVLEKDFKVSHNSKHTSIYLTGYKSAMVDAESDQFTDSDDFDSEDVESEDEPIPLEPKANGKLEVKEKKAGKALSTKGEAKPDGSSAKPKAAVLKSETPKPEEDESDDDDEDDEDDSEDDDSASDDEDMVDAGAGDDSDEDEDEDDSSDDEDVTPEKVEVGKKRASSASKTPVSEKKAKLVTPVGKKTDGDGKKDGHTATPRPKQDAKASANKEKSNQQTPKSVGAVACKSCTKTFATDAALQSHTKAKHEAK